MKCYKQEENTTDQTSSKKHGCGSGLKHMLLMLVCCLAPLGMIVFLQQNGNANAAGYLLFLLCPILHLVMMRGMGHKPKADEKPAVKS